MKEIATDRRGNAIEDNCATPPSGRSSPHNSIISNTTMTQTQSPDAERGHPSKADTLNVTVRYAAAPKPFHDHDATRHETLEALKARVLAAFGLSDGQSTPDGNTVTYKLYHGKTELTDMSATLGALAGQAHALALKLSQHIQQGRSVDRGTCR